MGIMLDLDLKKCTACGACAIACMDQNDIDTEKGIRPFRTVFDWEKRGCGGNAEYVHISIACMHCTDAPCAMACPFGIPAFNEEGRMQKCDGCAVRVRHGLEPACVKVCPSRALHLVHTGDVEGLDASRSLEKARETVLKAQV